MSSLRRICNDLLSRLDDFLGLSPPPPPLLSAVVQYLKPGYWPSEAADLDRLLPLTMNVYNRQFEIWNAFIIQVLESLAKRPQFPDLVRKSIESVVRIYKSADSTYAEWNQLEVELYLMLHAVLETRWKKEIHQLTRPLAALACAYASVAVGTYLRRYNGVVSSHALKAVKYTIRSALHAEASSLLTWNHEDAEAAAKSRSGVTEIIASGRFGWFREHFCLDYSLCLENAWNWPQACEACHNLARLLANVCGVKLSQLSVR